MKKLNTTHFLIVILVLLAALLGYNYFEQPLYNRYLSKQAEERKLTQAEAEIADQESQQNEYLENLTPQQKIAQLIAAPLLIEDFVIQTERVSASSSAKPVTPEWIKQNNPGVITVFGDKISTSSAVRVISDVFEDYSSDQLIPWIAVDHEGGTVQRFSGSGFSKLPSWLEMCSQDKKVQKAVFENSAEELATLGVKFVFAPVIDVATNHPVLRSRVCADFESTAQAAESYIEAFAQIGIMPVVKHFPGIGKTTKDLHTSFQQVDLQKEDLEIFQDFFDKYPNIGVMTAHVGVKDLFDGEPCSLSKECLEKFEKDYPSILIFTDALEMGSTGVGKLGPSLAQVAIKAVLAGNDILVFGKEVSADDLDEVISLLSSEYQNSTDFQQSVDQSLLKVLPLKQPQ